MADLKTEYASMEAAALHIRTAISHLPGAVADFRRASGSMDAFGHLPEAGKAKHTIQESMNQLSQFAGDLQTEWNSEASALTGGSILERHIKKLTGWQTWITTGRSVFRSIKREEVEGEW